MRTEGIAELRGDDLFDQLEQWCAERNFYPKLDTHTLVPQMMVEPCVAPGVIWAYDAPLQVKMHPKTAGGLRRYLWEREIRSYHG